MASTLKIRRKKKTRNRRYTIILALLLFVLLFIKLIFFSSKADFMRLFNLSNDEPNLIIDTQTVGDGIIQNNGIYYIAFEKVRQFIDPNIYYNADEGRVIITTAENVVRMTTEETRYLFNDEEMELNFPVFNDNDAIYLPIKTIEEIYGIESKILNYNRILSVDTAYGKGELTKNTKLFVSAEGGKYYAKLKKGDIVYTYEENEKYTKVKVMESEENQGFVGYVPTEVISEIKVEAKQKEASVLWQPKAKINLMFDQISNAAGASKTISRGKIEGVNVLCPTWFSFKDSSGEIINKANMDYVEWANENGYQVWGLVTDNFDSDISHAVLSDDKTRQYAIKQLLAYAKMYGLGGINIDFESVPKGDGVYWIQFLRELTPLCHKEGIIVSVDTFVPKFWTAHYNREAIGEIVDYVIVMGYDEHYRGSSESGSVASMAWSEIAIKDTIKSGVPKEKLILGIPFYTRVWTEKADGTLESCAYSMDSADEILEQNFAVISYDEKTGQNYGEFTDENGNKNKCWLEDKESVEKRVKMAVDEDIAGIGAWKLGMESDGIIDVINSVLNTCGKD